MLDTLLQDIRYALRTARRQPGFSALAIGTLALGIGATTAIFSVVDAVLLRPPPFAEPDRLVMIAGSVPSRGADLLPLSYPNFRDLRAGATAFDAMAGWVSGPGMTFALTDAGAPEEVRYALASGELFALLGITPAAGRLIGVADDAPESANVVMISNGLWRRRFGSAATAVGASLTLNGEAYTIAGVLPAGFRFGDYPAAADVWLPLGQDPAGMRRGQRSRTWPRGATYIVGAARMREGATLESARADLERMSARLAADFPAFNDGWHATALPLRDQAVREIRPALLILLAAVAMVVLIACVNLANLLLARATTREREIRIRHAVGASRRRIVRLLFTEAMVLATLGGVAGVLLAAWSLDLLARLPSLPSAPFAPYEVTLDGVKIDPRVLGFMLVLTMATGILFGLAPALHAASADLRGALQERTGGPRGERVRNALVVAEIALAATLAIGAALLVRSLFVLEGVDTGMRADGVVAAEVNLPGARYPSGEQAKAFFDELLERAGALPGVTAVGLTESLPLDGYPGATDFRIEGRDPPIEGQEPSTRYTSISAGYIEAMGIRLAGGRAFTGADDAHAPAVAIINQAMADRFWPGEDAIGKRFALSIEALRFGPAGPPTLDFPSAYRVVVGIVSDVRQERIDVPAGPAAFVPIAQRTTRHALLVARTSGDPVTAGAALRATVLAIDPAQPVARIATLDAIVARSLGQARLRTWLLALFAALAAGLAVVGIYGVVSYSVAQRTREMAVRMALGASPGGVLRLVVRHSLALAAVGVMLGAVGALGAGRVLERMLFGVTTTDFPAFAIAGLGISIITVAATLIPARRATLVEPVSVLRDD